VWLGVLDVGSNTVHLLVVDAYRGGRPAPAHSEKTLLRLAEHIDPAGRLTRAGADAHVADVQAARRPRGGSAATTSARWPSWSSRAAATVLVKAIRLTADRSS
jgi:hypothetical protein